jgi:hypothetical protein
VGISTASSSKQCHHGTRQTEQDGHQRTELDEDSGFQVLHHQGHATLQVLEILFGGEIGSHVFSLNQGLLEGKGLNPW